MAIYVDLRVRSFNADGLYSDYVYSTPPQEVHESYTGVVAPPTQLSDPTVSVLDQEGNFGLRTAWTPPSDLGSIAGYDREVRYYSDNGAATAVSDWIPLGSVGKNAVTADSGWWPRPALTQYVQLRVRAYNGAGVTGEWVLSATPLPAVSPLAAPSAPASNTSSIETGTVGGIPSFRFHIVMTGSSGPVSGYLAQVQYYSSTSPLTSISEWISLGWLDPNTLSMDTDWWPLSDTEIYAIVRVAGLNADNTLGDWLESDILTRDAAADVSGSFTTTDGKTVTVANGRITSIV